MSAYQFDSYPTVTGHTWIPNSGCVAEGLLPDGERNSIAWCWNGPKVGVTPGWHCASAPNAAPSFATPDEIVIRLLQDGEINHADVDFVNRFVPADLASSRAIDYVLASVLRSDARGDALPEDVRAAVDALVGELRARKLSARQ